MKKLLLSLITFHILGIYNSNGQDFNSFVNLLIDDLKNSKTTFEYIFSEKDNNIYEKNEYYSKKTGTTYIKAPDSKIDGYLGDKTYFWPQDTKDTRSSDQKYFSTVEVFKFFSTSTDKNKYFVQLYDYFYYGTTPNDFIGKAPSEMPKSIHDEVYRWNYFSQSTFKYFYIKELGLFLVKNSSDNLQIFDPIYGPLLFDQKPTTLIGLKGEAHKSPLLNNPYSFEYYVKNYSGNFPKEGYTYSTKDNSMYPEKLPNYKYSNIEAFEQTPYLVAENYCYSIEGGEHLYYPSYQEKLAVYNTGALPLRDLNNPNFYIIKEEPDKEVYRNGILSPTGYCIIPMIYHDIKPLYGNYFISKLNDKFGLLKLTSERLKSQKMIIYDNIFDEIINNGDGTLLVKINGKSLLIDFFGNKLLQQLKTLNESENLNNIGNAEKVRDIDGNEYHTVKIGTQVWIVENLKTTRYRNGEKILNITNVETWPDITTGAYCSMENDSLNVSKYGLLYNWYAATDSRNIAPEGWHVPNSEEWKTLLDFLGGIKSAQSKLIQNNGHDRFFYKYGGDNSSGFTAIPGGYLDRGHFCGEGMEEWWWTSTEFDEIGRAMYVKLPNFDNNIFATILAYKANGLAIRLVKDE